MVHFAGASEAATNAGVLEHSSSFDLCDDILDPIEKTPSVTDYAKS